MVLLCLELLTRLNGTIIQRITCIAACISAWYYLICTKKFYQKTVILIKYMYSVHKPTVGNSSASTFHSQQRRLVMKPSKLQRMISLFRFQPGHVIATLHNSNVKMASRVSWKLKFESKILVLTVKFAVNLSNIVMPGDELCHVWLWEYGSYRMRKRTTKKWREDWLGEITKTREVDRDFKRQLCLHAIPTIFYMDEGC